MPLPPKEARARFTPLVAHVSREWRRAMDGRLQAYGLTEATWLPLLRIARSEAPMRQNELAASLSLNGSSVVRLLETVRDRLGGCAAAELDTAQRKRTAGR
jgi:MarR family transcriptional regulator, transcriptional regulator for hemolysin